MAESANVDILINAFTDAAEQALDSVGDELTNLGADGQVAQSTLDEVADELDDTTTSSAAAGQAMDSIDTAALAAGMAAVANQADEAGDEIAQAGRRSAITSGLFSQLSFSAGGLSASLGILSTAMTVSLIPAALTLSTALLPLAGILGGAAVAAASLAAVFGGLAVAGVVTHMDELKTALADARAEIMEIIQPLGEVFGPLLVDAVEALPELVRRIVNSLGPLDQFADGLRELGTVAMTAIPQATGVMFELAEQALPVLIDVMRWLQANGPGIANAVAEAWTRLDGPLMAVGSAVADLLPDLFDLGIIVAELVLPALADIVGFVDSVVEAVLSMDDAFSRLAVAGTITAPAIFGVASAVGSLLGPIGLAAGAVAAFVAAYRSNFLGIGDATDAVIGDVISLFEDLAAAVQPVIEDVIATAESWADTFESVFQGAASGGLGELTRNLQALGQQVVSLVTDLATQARPIFQTIARTLTRNSDTFREFGRIAVQALNGLVNIIRNVVLPAVRFVFQNFIIPLLNRLVTVWSQNFGTILREVIETIDAIVSYIRPVLNALAAFWRSHGNTVKEAVQFAFDAIIGIIGTALDAVYTAIIVVLNLIQGDWDEAWNAITGFAEDALDGLVDFFEDWGILETIGGVLVSIGQFFIDLFTKTIPNVVASGLAWLLGHIMSVMNQIHNFFANIWNAIVQVGVGAIEGMINFVIDALNGFLSTLDDVADAVSEIPGVDFSGSIQTLDRVSLDTEGIEASRRETDAAVLRDQARQGIDAAVSLTIEGTGALADLMREEAEATVETREREQTRRQRRQRPTG